MGPKCRRKESCLLQTLPFPETKAQEMKEWQLVSSQLGPMTSSFPAQHELPVGTKGRRPMDAGGRRPKEYLS